MKAPVAVVLSSLLLIVCALAVSACSSSDASTKSDSSSPTASETTIAQQADSAALGSLIKLITTAMYSFSYEPRGDVPEHAWGTLVFAEVRAAKKGTLAVSFDARQLYVGTFADTASARDGRSSATDTSGIYSPNRYLHTEVLPLAEDCPVALLDSTVPGGYVTPTAAQFVASLRRSGSLRCWLRVGAGEIDAVIQQY